MFNLFVEMRINLLIVMLLLLALVAQSCRGQVEKSIVVLTLTSDRVELAKALSFLRSSNSKLICLNVDLSKCNQDSVDRKLIKEFNEI